MDLGERAPARTEGETIMHRHFEDRFDAIDLGVRTATRARMLVDGGGSGKPAPTPTTTVHTRPVTGDGGRAKTVPVTPHDQVKEAIKDGAISTKEKTAFDKTPAATSEALKSEQTRLSDAVKKAQGDDLERDDTGRVKLEDGKLVGKPEAIIDPTDHEKLVKSLGETRDSEGLDKIDARIKQLEDAGATVGLDALKQERTQRAGDESKVVAVVEDKLALVGTLEAEKLSLDSSATKVAKDDYQSLRTEAQKYIEQFNANGGQFYEGNDWFGDDWDASKVDFDRLASRFHDDPDKLKEFAEVQGQDDDHLRGKSTEEVGKYLADLDDSEEATKIALRYQAAQELQGIFGRYNTARDAVDGQQGQTAALDAEIGYLNDSVETDLSVLSPESLDAVERHVTPIDGIIEDPNVKPTATTGGGDRPNKTNPNAPSEKPGTEPPKPNETPNAPAGGPKPETKPETRTVEIDYSAPEQRTQVLTQAQAKNLLPEQHVEFNDKGEAVYNVQSGDSYWRIADMSDGKPQDQFDPQHFSALVTTNSERLGRDPQVGLIHPDEQVIIQNRSIDELIKLLELPTTQDVPVEADPGPANDHGSRQAV